MRKVTYFVIIAALAGTFFTSCNKDDNNLNDATATEEVADEIAAAIGDSNSGLTSEINELAMLADEYTSSLKSELYDTIYAVDTSFTRTNQAGTLTTYNYTYQMEYGYVFMNGILNNMYYTGSISGNMDAPRIGSTDNRTSNWTLTGLEVTSSYYIINGTTSRTGSSKSKIRNESQITSNSQIILTNVKINKSNLIITEGSLSWIFTGSVNEQTYNYSANITYLGNGKAGLTINGMNYTINISKGEIE